MDAIIVIDNSQVLGEHRPFEGTNQEELRMLVASRLEVPSTAGGSARGYLFHLSECHK
jgi:hypothetical protein